MRSKPNQQIQIIYLPSFNKELKRLRKQEHINTLHIKKEFRNKLAKYVEAHDNIYQFPNSGAGIGNVWKKRVDGRGGFRIIYFALPKHLVLICIFIYPKNKQSNLTTRQKNYIREHKAGLKEIVKYESKRI